MSFLRNNALWAILLALAIVLLIGDCRHRVRQGEGAAGVMSSADRRKLRDLKSLAGLKLPAQTVLVGAEDSGDPHYKSRYYLPPGVPDGGYLDLPLADAVRYVEARMPGRPRVVRPTSCFFSTWRKGGYEFSGVVVRCDGGDYLVVERHRER